MESRFHGRREAGRESARTLAHAREHEIAQKQAELGRRERASCAARTPVPLQGRSAILVDDGLAAGASMLAVVQALTLEATRDHRENRKDGAHGSVR